MLARGVCRAEAASGGTRLAFGANQFQSWLRRPRIRRVPPAGSPAKAGWWYRLRTQRAPAPGGMSPSPEVRQGQPRPHFQPKNRQELFALPESFFKATLAHAPSQNSEDTRDGAGAGREWWEAREREGTTEVTTYPSGWGVGPVLCQELGAGNRNFCPYK